MQFAHNTALQFDILFGIIGLFVGCFVNQLALRSLREESVFSPLPQCPKCHHRLKPWESIPLVSYFLLKGKCKYCTKAISWPYPLVEIITALCFVLIVHNLGRNWYSMGMLFFVSTLIAVCITDFKEKLIPHEITYPAIIVGIIFSINIRHDFLGMLAGIGVSYIFFDFLAFYGLKVYLWLHKPESFFIQQKPASLDLTGALPATVSYPARKPSYKFSSYLPTQFLKESGKEQLKHGKVTLVQGQPIEEVEVIGGGDAVLSALISSWLGLSRLIIALLVSFIVGTFMGVIYVLYEMYKHKILKLAIRPVLLGVGLGVLLVSIMIFLTMSLTHLSLENIPWLILLFGAGSCGAIWGILSVGTRVAKPFPFGPALAIGAAIAMFYDPLAGFAGI